MPEVSYRDADGQRLPADAPAESVAESVYEIRIKPGVRYQPHPAFAVDADGKPVYAALDDARIGKRSQIGDFEQVGTREVTAADVAYQIKRLARPRIEVPALSIFAPVLGLQELATRLEAEVAAGRIDPDGWIDLRQFPLEGVETPDEHTLRIRIRGKYPQFVYWLSTSFVVPMPWEAERFYGQPGMAVRELTLDMWPVGTGPFMLTRNLPLREIRLERNPNYRLDTYPCEGAPGDREAGLLADCGKRLPLVDGFRFSYEREPTTFWNKFLQGYYDLYASTRFATLASFDSALQFQGGALSLSPDMEAHGITLRTEVEPAIEYFFVNMLDPVLGDGGATAEARERARKLRQAIAIAIDVEEYLAIIKNGLGLPMQGPIPPGIAGFRSGAEGINPHTYSWANGRPRRRGLDEAMQLLAEAGYRDGRDVRTGEPLIIHFDAYDSFQRSRLELLIKQLGRIKVQLVPRLTEWNRFQEKQRKGNLQLSFWGWNADYPDPENLLFLFYSKNGKVRHQGENVTNYERPEFDRLYEEFRGMDLDADRQAVIDRMVGMLRHDAPVLAGWNNEAFQLPHQWLRNAKPGKVIHSYRKYYALDPARRSALRAQWNRPVVWPMALTLAALAGLGLLGVRHYRRRERQTVRPGSPS
jgi:ABC-type transport system substrate-binding protein